MQNEANEARKDMIALIVGSVLFAIATPGLIAVFVLNNSGSCIATAITDTTYNVTINGVCSYISNVKPVYLNLVFSCYYVGDGSVSCVALTYSENILIGVALIAPTIIGFTLTAINLYKIITKRIHLEVDLAKGRDKELA